MKIVQVGSFTGKKIFILISKEGATVTAYNIYTDQEKVVNSVSEIPESFYVVIPNSLENQIKGNLSFTDITLNHHQKTLLTTKRDLILSYICDLRAVLSKQQYTTNIDLQAEN